MPCSFSSMEDMVETLALRRCQSWRSLNCFLSMQVVLWCKTSPAPRRIKEEESIICITQGSAQVVKLIVKLLKLDELQTDQ
jgi:hypothetical protein